MGWWFFNLLNRRHFLDNIMYLLLFFIISWKYQVFFALHQSRFHFYMLFYNFVPDATIPVRLEVLVNIPKILKPAVFFCDVPIVHIAMRLSHMVSIIFLGGHHKRKPVPNSIAWPSRDRIAASVMLIEMLRDTPVTKKSRLIRTWSWVEIRLTSFIASSLRALSTLNLFQLPSPSILSSIVNKLNVCVRL